MKPQKWEHPHEPLAPPTISTPLLPHAPFLLLYLETLTHLLFSLFLFFFFCFQNPNSMYVNLPSNSHKKKCFQRVVSPTFYIETCFYFKIPSCKDFFFPYILTNSIIFLVIHMEIKLLIEIFSIIIKKYKYL